MNILADENIAQQVVDRLRQDGHNVRYTIQGQGIADTIVLATAYHEQALILTDDKDFGDLIIQQGLQTVGVVLVRFPGVPHAERAEIVARVFQEHGDSLMDAITVITSGKVRIRNLRG